VHKPAAFVIKVNHLSVIFRVNAGQGHTQSGLPGCKLQIWKLKRRNVLMTRRYIKFHVMYNSAEISQGSWLMTRKLKYSKIKVTINYVLDDFK
jgi:hypothetical protein